MGSFVFRGIALATLATVAVVPVACSSADNGTVAGDAGSPSSSDGSTITPQPDGSTPVSDAGADVATNLEAGQPGFCESQFKGPYVVALGVVSGSTNLYRVYTEGAYDEEWVHLTIGSNLDFSAADFALGATHLYVSNGANHYVTRLPIPNGTLNLPTPISFTEQPPTVLYFVGRGAGNQFELTARNGSTLYAFDIDAMVGSGTWRSLGAMPGLGACGSFRGFSRGILALPAVEFFASCPLDPANGLITVSYSAGPDGGVMGTTIGAGPAVQDQVLAQPLDGVLLTTNKLYVGGAFKRNLAVCRNNGTLISPIGGLRTAHAP